MWQRPLLFVMMAACLSSSIVPRWGQSRLPSGNRQDTVEALSSERHKPRHEEWRNVAGSMFNFRPLSRNRTFVASAYLAQNTPEKANWHFIRTRYCSCGRQAWHRRVRRRIVTAYDHQGDNDE